MKKPSKQQSKFEKVMREFYAGTLKSSSGRKVTSRAQAMAIAASESGMLPKKKRKPATKKKR
jgi:ribosomal protein L13